MRLTGTLVLGLFALASCAAPPDLNPIERQLEQLERRLEEESGARAELERVLGQRLEKQDEARRDLATDVANKRLDVAGRVDDLSELVRTLDVRISRDEAAGQVRALEASLSRGWRFATPADGAQALRIWTGSEALSQEVLDGTLLLESAIAPPFSIASGAVEAQVWEGPMIYTRGGARGLQFGLKLEPLGKLEDDEGVAWRFRATAIMEAGLEAAPPQAELSMRLRSDGRAVVTEAAGGQYTLVPAP